MKPKFKFNQFIVKKTRDIMDNFTYGVFKVTPYVTCDVAGNRMEFDITYKVVLVPVGKGAKMLSKQEYYTSDLWDIPEERIFDDKRSAEKMLKEYRQAIVTKNGWIK